MNRKNKKASQDPKKPNKLNISTAGSEYQDEFGNEI